MIKLGLSAGRRHAQTTAKDQDAINELFLRYLLGHHQAHQPSHGLKDTKSRASTRSLNDGMSEAAAALQTSCGQSESIPLPLQAKFRHHRYPKDLGGHSQHGR